MEINIFTGATSVRSKNIFTAISRYPTRKHEITSDMYKSISSDMMHMKAHQFEQVLVNKVFTTEKFEFVYMYY